MALFHVWFSTKGRKGALVGEVHDFVLAKFGELSAAWNINLIESATEFDHVHLLLRLPDELDLPAVMHMLKGHTSRQVTFKFPEIKGELGKSFWQKSYGFRPVPEDQLPTVRHYIQTQSDRPIRHIN